MGERGGYSTSSKREMRCLGNVFRTMVIDLFAVCAVAPLLLKWPIQRKRVLTTLSPPRSTYWSGQSRGKEFRPPSPPPGLPTEVANPEEKSSDHLGLPTDVANPEEKSSDHLVPPSAYLLKWPIQRKRVPTTSSPPRPTYWSGQSRGKEFRPPCPPLGLPTEVANPEEKNSDHPSSPPRPTYWSGQLRGKEFRPLRPHLGLPTEYYPFKRCQIPVGHPVQECYETFYHVQPVTFL